MIVRILVFFVVTFYFGIFISRLTFAEVFPKKPSLVVTVVFDQFRADYLARFQERFLKPGTKNLPGGFNFLLSRGAYFPQAEYQLLQCMTGPGHSVISSGSYPHATGLVLNYWIDRSTGEKAYCTNHDLKGMSMRGFTGSTLSDEYKNSGYPSKVVSIALKDRAAILMGGYHSDLSLWWNRKDREWMTSDFFSKDGLLPQWVQKINKKTSTQKRLYNLASSQGFDLTMELVQEAIKSEKLGQIKGQTDFLWVSFSSFDYAGHAHGANSEAMTEMTLEGDRTLARLLKILSKEIPGGLNSVVVGLTGDHGVGPAPKFMAGKRVSSGAINVEEMLPYLEKIISNELGSPDSKSWVIGTSEFNLYLDPKSGSSEELKKARLILKNYFNGFDWVQGSFTLDDYISKQLPMTLPVQKIEKTFFPSRSGDVVVIPKPFFIEYDPKDTAGHMTPYPYDCQVPLVMYGANIKSGRYSVKIDPADYVFTLSGLLGTQPSVFSSGRVLFEVLR